MTGRLRILHLSDIHFRKGFSGESSDLDRDGRDQLFRDARELADSGGPYDAVLITGDVAFGGKAEEYEIASNFLEDLASLTKNGRQRIKVVPGNHDVDRNSISAVGSMVRDRLRGCPPAEIDDELRAVLTDPDLSAACMRPLDEYNSFAATLGCAIDAKNWWWQWDELALGDATVRVTGLTTALVCDHTDSDQHEKTKMVVGLRQTQIPHADRTIEIVMGHHPPGWWRDGAAPSNHLGRAHVQLFGHLHNQHLSTVNGSIVLVAGALHPERELGWYPRYNVLELSLDDEGLGATLFPRRWGEQATRFVPDSESGAYPIVRTIESDFGTPSSASVGTPDEPDPSEPATVPPGDEVSLVYALINDLTYGQQLAVFGEMGVVTESDMRLSGGQLRTAALDRVRTDARFSELWDRVSETSSSLGPNPFDADRNNEVQ